MLCPEQPNIDQHTVELVYSGTRYSDVDRADCFCGLQTHITQNFQLLTGMGCVNVVKRLGFSEGDYLIGRALPPGIGVDVTNITKTDFDGQPRSPARPTPGADVPLK